jgi:hypothetical protein
MLSQIQHESDLLSIEEYESAITQSILDCIRKDLDWGDYLDVAEYILGDIEQVRDLRELVNRVHGLDIKPQH